MVCGMNPHLSFGDFFLLAFNKIVTLPWRHLRTGMREDKICPNSTLQRSRLLPEAVRMNSDCWCDMTEQDQTDEEFVRNIESFDSKYLVKEIFRAIPGLRHDRDIWENVIKSKHFDQEMAQLAPIYIPSDRDLMMKACAIDIRRLQDVAPSLAMDKAFLQQVIDMNPDALCHVSQEAQLQFPELMIDNLAKIFAIDKEFYLPRRLHPDLLASPSFNMKWFSLGGDYDPKFFPDSLRDDKQVFLLLAQHCRWLGSFKEASNKLKSDRDFVWKLTKVQPYIYFGASDAIQNEIEFKLCMLAMGSSQVTGEYVKRVHEQEGGEQELEELLAFLQGKVDATETYMTSILLGISLPADASLCPLTILNQGNETFLVYKTLIADYAGVPTKASFVMHKHALVNLRKAVTKLRNERGGQGNDGGDAEDD